MQPLRSGKSNTFLCKAQQCITRVFGTKYYSLLSLSEHYCYWLRPSMAFPSFPAISFPFPHTRKLTEPYLSTLHVTQYKSSQSRDILEYTKNVSPNRGTLNLGRKPENVNVINTSLSSPLGSGGSQRITTDWWTLPPQQWHYIQVLRLRASRCAIQTMQATNTAKPWGRRESMKLQA